MLRKSEWLHHKQFKGKQNILRLIFTPMSHRLIELPQNMHFLRFWCQKVWKQNFFQVATNLQNITCLLQQNTWRKNFNWKSIQEFVWGPLLIHNFGWSSNWSSIWFPPIFWNGSTYSSRSSLEQPVSAITIGFCDNRDVI